MDECPRSCCQKTWQYLSADVLKGRTAEKYPLEWGAEVASVYSIRYLGTASRQGCHQSIS